MPDGDRFDICIQCRYEGYAGGLWVGSMDGSGFSWTPSRPVRGFTSLNLFCAQDESLFDEDDRVEYDGGWSQNFGRGDDGLRLEFIEGQVVSDGRRGRDVILRSVNGRGCWRMTRHLLWPRGRAYVVITATVRNTCDSTRRFSFWTGDDPWVGTYRTSDGDVGWYNGGIVRTETAIPGPAFRHGGLYDLGNDLLGQSAAPFSNCADFIAIDPEGPTPTGAWFANSFAHSERDIEKTRPLDNRSLTALNIGWKDIRLEAGGEVRFAYALGRAITGEPGTTPAAPEIPMEHWRFDMALSGAAWTGAGSGRPVLPIRFSSETIRMRIDQGRLSVEGTYRFQNRLATEQVSTMFYPFPIDEAHPYPDRIEVDGAPFMRVEKGVIWRVRVPPNGVSQVVVRYTQQFRNREARYILTSTTRWGEPLESGEYEVSWPSKMRGVSVSYGGERSRNRGMTTLRFERKAFMPDRDIVVRY